MLKKLIFFILILQSSFTFSQTQLASFFSDNMVLQQNEKVSIWGKDNPNKIITIDASWGANATTSSDSNGYWKLKLQTPTAGGPYILTIKGSNQLTLRNVLIGEVWICSGQSNMEMPLKGFNNQPIDGSLEAIVNATNPQLRIFQVEKKSSLTPLDNLNGQWQSATPSSVKDFSATAYYFGKKLQQLLNVPIGLIHTSWGGSTAEAWTDSETLSKFQSVTLPTEIPKKRVNKAPTLLYNAMLHPFIGYTMKGVIWYQGEANRDRASKYNSIITAMVNSWRMKWKQGNFPFYFVQIAPFGYNGGKNAAFLREAQLLSMQTIENSGMAVTMDIGDCQNIHPRNKKTVGDRLAYWALSKSYNISGIAFSGPIYKKFKREKSKLIVSFDYVESGLSSFGNELNGFEIAGDDKIFHKAKASINWNKTISVWSAHVKVPVAVRYAFKNCVKGTLFNTQGLPASSFRTDNWED